MASFLRRCASFLVLLGAFLGGSRLLNAALAPVHHEAWDVAPEVLVIGDSHAVRGVDPALLPDARNVGELSQPIAITYHLARYLYDARPGIRTLVVTFGPHNIARVRDRALLGEQGHEHLRHYWGIVPWLELDGMSLSPAEYVGSRFRIWWTPNFHLIADGLFQFNRAQNHPYMGGYRVRTDPVSQGTLDQVIERHYPAADRERPVSDVQIAYLDSILDWAEEEDVRVVLLNTPQKPEYRARVPTPVADRFQQVWQRATRRPHVDGLDLSALDLPVDHYQDNDHVNRRGAAVVTERLRSFLESS